MSDNQNDQGAGAQPAASAPARAQTAAQPTLPTINVTPAVPTEYLQKLAAAEQRAAAVEAENKRLAALAAERDEKLVQMADEAKMGKAERERVERETRERIIRTDLRSLATELDAIVADDVVALAYSQFAIDETGKLVPASDPKADARAHLKAFLDKRPHMLRPKVAQGSGATGFTGQPPAAGEAPRFDLTTAEGMTAYARYITYPPGKAPSLAGK